MRSRCWAPSPRRCWRPRPGRSAGAASPGRGRPRRSRSGSSRGSPPASSAEAAGLLLIAGACLALAAAVALVAPAWSIELGLVAVAVVDVVLVWGTPQVEPASTALHHAALPVAAGHPLPPLQDATFGSATMGWLDLLAPALLGVVARARLRAAVVTGVAAGAWGLLLAVTSTLPATVPVLAGLLTSRM